ncbi:MAG: ATP-binding protein, partial [bacterium]
AKYSQATRVVIEVKDKNNTVTMTISDNGKGVNLRSLPASRSQPGWGISSMRTRAEDLGARFTIKGSPGKGTQVKVELERGV